MKRYWVFAGDYYYPSGGMHDFCGSADTINEAKAALRGADWAHVVDSNSGDTVARFSKWDGNDHLPEGKWFSCASGLTPNSSRTVQRSS